MHLCVYNIYVWYIFVSAWIERPFEKGCVTVQKKCPLRTVKHLGRRTFCHLKPFQLRTCWYIHKTYAHSLLHFRRWYTIYTSSRNRVYYGIIATQTADVHDVAALLNLNNHLWEINDHSIFERGSQSLSVRQRCVSLVSMRCEDDWWPHTRNGSQWWLRAAACGGWCAWRAECQTHTQRPYAGGVCLCGGNRQYKEVTACTKRCISLNGQ